MKLSYTLFDIQNSTAKHLLDIGAVDFRPEAPFTFTSGRVSPIYVDVRRVLGVSGVRANITSMAAAYIYKEIQTTNYNVVVGGETAGIPFASLIADRTHKPMGYVRKAPKGFGRGAQIEGLSDEQLGQGRRFLLVEDLCSDGGSKKNFIEAIRKSGNIVTDVLVIFSYGVFGAAEALAEEGIRLHTLTDAEKLVEVAADLEVFPAATLNEITKFLRSQRGLQPAVVAEAEAIEIIEPI